MSVHIKKMDHSALVVRNLERSRWFYGEVLGLQEVPRPPNFTFRGCWFRGPGFEFHLILAGDTTAPAGFAPAGEAAALGLAHHLALEVEDLDATIAHLETHGIAPVAGPLPRGDGVTQAYVNDPDGNFLEFFTWAYGATLRVEERPALAGDTV